MNYLSKKYGDRYTVLSPNGFVTLMEPRDVASQRLQAIGLSDEILDVRVKDAEWRAAFIAASAAEAVASRAGVELAASEADVDDVRRVQAKLEAAISELAAEITNRGNEADIQKLKAYQEAEFQRLVARHGEGLDSVGEAMFRAHLATTAAGRRLAELEAQSESS